jgi:hypothetical protein
MKLFIVELNSPYQNWLEPQMQFYFSKMVELKRIGYARNYPSHYLPVDTSDFIGIHHLICKQEGSRIDLVAGFRTIYLEQSEFFKIPFPATAIASRVGQNTELHLKAVMNLIENAKLIQTKLIFGSSWTIHPDAKEEPELVQLAKEMTTAVLYWYQTEKNIKEGLALGVIKAKTDVHFGEQGYSPIQYEGVELPTFKVIDVDEKEVRLMHRTCFTESAYALAEKYQSLWKSRVVIGSVFGLLEAEIDQMQAA